MAQQDVIDTTKQVIADLVAQMGVKADIEVREQPGNVVFNLRTADTNMLIGKHGINLYALQYICRILARRKTGQELDFLVDVDDYKRKRETFLENLALEVADEVADKRQTAVVRALPAYERRIIHARLSSDPRVETDSVGEEPHRMVVVHPKGNKNPIDASIGLRDDEDFRLVE